MENSEKSNKLILSHNKMYSEEDLVSVAKLYQRVKEAEKYILRNPLFYNWESQNIGNKDLFITALREYKEKVPPSLRKELIPLQTVRRLEKIIENDFYN